MQNARKRLGCLSRVGVAATLITLIAIVEFAVTSGSQMFSAGALNAKSGQAYNGVTSHAQITECSACHVAVWESETMADRCMFCHTNVSAQMMDTTTLHGAIREKDPIFSCRYCHPEHRGADAPLTDLTSNVFPHETLGFSLNGHQRKPTGESFVCRECHQENITTFTRESCLTCHQEIDVVFTQSHIISFGMECLACHDGVDRLGKNNFSHASFNFPLNGKHAETACEKCHLNARALADLQAAPQDCYSCHKDADKHLGRFGVQCSTCHSPVGWKPANFDHNIAAFKLEGKHSEVACAECHTTDAYQLTPTDCYSCHQDDDKHQGESGRDCAACHTPNNWDDANIDHNAFAFRLDGAHANVACNRCHVNGQYKNTLMYCSACHADPNFHAGAFGVNCAECHSTSSWSPARFDLSHPEVADEGGRGINHGHTSCKTCHPSTVRETTCRECHNGNMDDDD